MEVYAAIMEHTDHHSGRVIDALITPYYDGKPVGSGRVEFSQAMIFSADETTDDKPVHVLGRHLPGR